MSLRTALFAAVCLAQLAVPASLIAKHEATRASGTPWKFQTAPVDPDDPFRGKYVQLSYQVEQEPVAFADEDTVHVEYNRRMYAELAQGADGYARLVRLHEERPTGVDYIDVFTRGWPERSDDAPPPRSAILVRLPFDRYYLTEHRAPEVERAYRDASRSAQANTYAEIRVRDGHGALVQLVLDGKPVAP